MTERLEDELEVGLHELVLGEGWNVRGITSVPLSTIPMRPCCSTIILDCGVIVCLKPKEVAIVLHAATLGYSEAFLAPDVAT